MYSSIFEVRTEAQPEPGLRATPTPKKIIIMINTDPGRDVDDEAGIGWLIYKFLKSHSKYDIQLIIVVKTGEAGIERLLRTGVKPYTGLDLKPTEVNTINMNSGAVLTIEFLDGTKNLSNDRKQLPLDVQPHFILSIAQGLDDVITLENLNDLKGFSHQGLGTGYGFNDSNSMKMLKIISDLNISSVITTPNESFENLFGTKVFESFQMPTELQKFIIFDAINMLLKRMAPTLPIIVLQHAEGLINIRYAETINKPGSNARLVMQIRKEYTGRIHDISDEMRESIHNACVEYVDSIIQAGVAAGRDDLIKHIEETIESLYNLTFALAEMGLPALTENNTRLLYSTDGDIVEKYPDVFETVKEIGLYTPAYDLIAAQKLFNLLEEHDIFEEHDI